jgi:hypothetical protein
MKLFYIKFENKASVSCTKNGRFERVNRLIFQGIYKNA